MNCDCILCKPTDGGTKPEAPEADEHPPNEALFPSLTPTEPEAPEAVTKLTDAGLVTDDPVIASMFLGENIEFMYNEVDSQPAKGKLVLIGDDMGAYFEREGKTWQYDAVLIPYPLIKAAIQPVEGEGYVYDDDELTEYVDIVVLPNYRPRPVEGCYHKRVLNIVTTRAELRELIGRCEG
jgi:hypothetical protein